MIELNATCRGDEQGRLIRRPDASARLELLGLRAAEEMERVEAFGRVWAPAPEPPQFNIVICGAGMSGLALAFGLKRRGVEGVALIDQRARGAEGPWTYSARMKTLRSPKQLSGPDLGVAALTPRAWHDAVYGEDAWARLYRIDRQDWADYLEWFRHMTQPPVVNDCRLVGVEPDPFGLALSLEGAGLPARVRCRRLVMATGIEGAGPPRVPEIVASLPKRFWSHSAEECPGLDFAGRNFIVVGAAASSLDWAVSALEGGAARVELIARKPGFARTEVLDWTNFPGYLSHLAELDDSSRWRFAELFLSFKMPPTQDQFDRARAYPNFVATLGRHLRAARVEGEEIAIEHDGGVSRADHLLLGTGYETNVAAIPPLRDAASRALFWRDRAAAEAGRLAEIIGAHPYLGGGFELLAKDRRDDWISRIHLFNNSAIASLGPISNGVTGMKYGAPRLLNALAGRLFAERADELADQLGAYSHPHFDPRGLGEGGSS